MSEYISKLTEFRAYEAPYTDIMYLKDGNKLVCIIHIDKDWNMVGDVIDPFNIPISPLEPIYGQLNQYQCECLIMRNMAPLSRKKQLIKKYNFKDKVDYAQILYRTRLVNLIDTYWIAWSLGDKAEEYHPRFNDALMEQRFEGQIEIDPEEEDKKPFPKIEMPKGELFENNIKFEDLNFEFED